MIKGDISINTIAYFSLVIIFIIVTVVFLWDKMKPVIFNSYCGIIRNLRNFLPFPSYLKPSMPKYCKMKDKDVCEEVEMMANLPDSIAFNIASYVLACWEQTGKVNLSDEKCCYELIMLHNPLGMITEEMVRENLPEDYRDVMIWERGIINSKLSLLIEYDGQNIVVR